MQLRRFEELRSAGNVCVKVYARVRSEGGSNAGTWYECGEVAASEGQSVQEAVWAAKTYIFEYSTWQFPALLSKKRLLEVCVLAVSWCTRHALEKTYAQTQYNMRKHNTI